MARDEPARAAAAAAWVNEGLALGEQVLWVQPADGPLYGWLDGHGVDWREPVASGRLRTSLVEDVLGLRSEADIPRRIEQTASLAHDAVGDGFARLRVGADTADALRVIPDVATQLRLEEAWEDATLTEPLSLLCLYDPAVHGFAMTRGVGTHPRELADSLVRAEASGREIALRGEVDVSNAELVGAFLDAAVPPGSARLTLDLRGCSFVDLTGAQRLVAFARAQAPRRVRLQAPPRALVRVLELTGVLDVFEVVHREGA